MEGMADYMYDIPVDDPYGYFPEYEDGFGDEMAMAYDGDYESYPFYDPAFMAADDMHYGSIPFSDLLHSCIFTTVGQMWQVVLPLLGMCVVHKISVQFFSFTDIGWLQNLGSSVLGIVALHFFFNHNILYVIVLVYLSYLLLLVTSKKCNHLNGVAVSVVCVVYLLTCELLVVQETEWHQIRGAQMVMTMKIISLAFDLDYGEVDNLPDVFQYSAYTLHVGSVIFGPWISFNCYINTQRKKANFLSRTLALKIIKCVFMMVACIAYSTCITHWLIYDHSWRWLVAYRDAQSFRFSHYFVCFLSELTCLVACVDITEEDKHSINEVAHPLQIELPRSLVAVVTNWNMPMHHWLKTYVFKTTRPLGAFAAVLLTYAASSLLHGLNFQLAAVLFSLGFYSYVEYKLRRRLAKVFSACIEAKSCKPECDHSLTAGHPITVTINLLFGFLSIFHLAYLGLMFDSSGEEDKGYTMSHTLEKWSHLSFASHWVALATFVLYWLI